MDKDYLIAHASDFEKQLLHRLNQFKIDRYVQIDEFTVEILFLESNVAVKILDDTHDHTDSYHLEAQLLKKTTDAGIKLLFVEDCQGIEAAVEKIRIAIGFKQ